MWPIDGTVTVTGTNIPELSRPDSNSNECVLPRLIGHQNWSLNIRCSNTQDTSLCGGIDPMAVYSKPHR